MGVRVAENGKVVTAGAAQPVTPVASPASQEQGRVVRAGGVRVASPAPPPKPAPKKKAQPVADPFVRVPEPEKAPTYDPLDAILHPPDVIGDILKDRDPEKTYMGPGSGAIPSVDATDYEAAERVGRDIGSVNPETGEMDPERADPMEKVLPARVDQATREKARGLLTDRSLRDIFSHGDQTTWVEQRQQQLLNNQFASAPPKDEAEREAANEKAYWKAVDELATLATVGYSPAFPLPLDKRPKSGSTWDLLTDKKVEVLGKDKDGNLVVRQQDSLSHAVDVLSIPQNLFSSTGIPEKAIQYAFGAKPGAPNPDDPDYARKVMAERRSFSDMARDADPQSMLAKAALYTGAFAGDVLFPDLLLVGGKALKIPAKGAEALLKTEKGVKALDATRTARAAVGLVSDADSAAHAARLLGMEEDAARVLDDVVDEAGGLAREAPAAERATAYAAKVEDVQKEAARYSPRMSAELERRALAATSEALAKEGDEVVRLAERAAEGAKGTTGLLRGLARVAAAAPPAEQAAAQAVVDAVRTGRREAARSLSEGLRATEPVVSGKAPTALSAVAEALGMGRKPAALKAVEKGVRDGGIVLDASQAEAVKNILGVPVAAGKPLTMRALAEADDAVAKARKVQVQAVSPRAALAETVRPRPLVDRAPVVARTAERAAELVQLPLRGADEAKPYLQEGLSRAVRDATIRGQRAVDSTIADAGKLKDEASAAMYLDGAPVKVGGKGLVSSGQSHLDLFRGAVELRIAASSAVRELSRAWVKDDALAKLVQEGSPLLDDLADEMVSVLSSGADGAEVLRAGREATARVLGEAAVQPDGWRRATAVLGANGQQVVAVEELLGSGAVLTSADRDAILNTLGAGGTAGRVPTALERAAEAGGIHALEDAERAQEAASLAYEKATDAASQLDALGRQGDAALAVAEARKKLAPASRTPATLSQAERATTVRQAVTPKTPDALVRVGQEAGSAVNVAGMSQETAARLEALNQALTGGYVPRKAREDLLAAAGRATSRPGESDILSKALSLYKQGVTRGIWMVSPRYNLFNFFGDAEQSFISHGARVAAKSTLRSAMLQATSSPLGQAAALVGKGEATRRVLSTVGDVVVNPGKVGEILSAMRKQGTLRGAMEAATSVSDVNRVMDGTDEAFRLGDRVVTGKHLREAAVRGGVFDSQPAALMAEEAEAGMRVLDQATKITSMPGKVSEALKESVQDVVEGIGERQRVGLYLTLVEHGATPAEAAEGVTKALYDYKYSMSEAERSAVFRWVLPWWAWQKNAYRQMTSALLSPGGAYRIKVAVTAPDKAAGWAEWLAEGGDVDPIGVREGIMSPDERDAYHRLVQYMTEQGLDGPQMRAALLEVAPNGRADGGIESWPMITPQLVADYQAVSPYIVPAWGNADVRSYELGRPMIRVRPDAEKLKALWDSPNASVADYYAWMLPPSMAESYFDWAGALAGIGTSLAGGGGGLGAVQQAVDVVDPERVPLVGLALQVAGGKKVVVPVSDALGSALAVVGLADVVAAKNRQGAPLTGEDPASVAARGRSPVKYAITNPTMALLYQSFGATLASVDGQARAWEDVMRDPSWRTGLKAWSGVPFADVQPAGTPMSESYGISDRMRVVPVADAPVGSAPVARPPTEDRSYAGEKR